MRNRLIQLIAGMLSLLYFPSCLRDTCPPKQDQAIENFRSSVQGLDGRFRFRELWINGVDSSSILDSMKLRNQVFRTIGYDEPFLSRDINNGCFFTLRYDRANYMEEIFNIAPEVYVGYFASLKTVIERPSELELNIGATKWIGSRDSISYFIQIYRPKYFIQVPYKLLYQNSVVSLTSNFQGREIRLVLTP